MYVARGRVFLILGVVLALLAGAAVYVLASRSRPQPVPQVTVIVASADIPARTFITDDNAKTLFATARWPATIVPPDTILTTGDVLGKVVVDHVAKGAPIMKANLSANKTTGQTGLSIEIPMDYVAEAIAISDVNGVAGALSPGDYVAIVVSAPLVGAATPGPVGAGTPTQPQPATAGASPTAPTSLGSIPLITQTTLQRVRVLAVGQRSTASAPPAGGNAPPAPSGSAPTVTFLLSHQQALEVKHMKDAGFLIDIVLRRYDDPKIDTQTVPVTRDYVEGKFNLKPSLSPPPTAIALTPVPAPTVSTASTPTVGATTPVPKAP